GRAAPPCRPPTRPAPSTSRRAAARSRSSAPPMRSRAALRPAAAPASRTSSATAAAPSNTTALLRGAAGCTDADSNATDLAIGDPAPRTSASPGAACSGGGSASGGTTTAGAAVDVDVEPVLSATLERTSIPFGSAFAGQTPSPVSEKVTVVSNDANGYSLTVHRSAFSPADLPLGIAPTGTGTLQ